ncbi:Ribonuclease HI [Vitis vinifera]|uniref:Ribonuclease HI n=1 Tax=Vitis vinifera TaxID=29760 RepID=A0A438HVA5_VITVI|nr:Ribonuclease HI [Vitis vinifera]
MLGLRTKKEISGFLGRLQYISRFIAKLIDTVSPFFNSRGRVNLLFWMISANVHLRGSGVLVVASNLGASYTRSSLTPILVNLRHSLGMHHSFDRYPATNNIVEYEACFLGLETTLKLKIRQMEVFGNTNLVLRQIQGHWKTRDVKLRPYHAYLELLVGRFDDLSYTHLPRAHNQFADALATIASMIDIPVDTVVHHLLIESRSVLAYCYLIDEVELDDGLPWYHDIYQFLRLGIYLEVATTKDKKALR